MGISLAFINPDFQRMWVGRCIDRALSLTAYLFMSSLGYSGFVCSDFCHGDQGKTQKRVPFFLQESSAVSVWAWKLNKTPDKTIL
jgi:hypothetical protein